jgi:hypothetical protein
MENIKDVKFFQGLPVATAVMKRQIEAIILLLTFFGSSPQVGFGKP